MKLGQAVKKLTLGGLVFGVGGVALALKSHAEVSLRNGNVFYSFRHFGVSAGLGLEWKLGYNSKTSFVGPMGFGQGSEYFTYLNRAPDGSLVVHEHGGGAVNRFKPLDYSEEDKTKAVKKLVKAAKDEGRFSNPEKVKEFKQKLEDNPQFRTNVYEQYVNNDVVERKKIKKGAKFTSNRFSYQYISKTKEGFVRVYDSGKKERFNEDGKLVRIEDTNDNFIKLGYREEDNKLKKLVDNLNNKLMIKDYNDDGFIKKIATSNGNTMKFSYDDNKNLVMSKDVEGNKYQYKYYKEGPLADKHYLKKIAFDDDSKEDNTIKIGYYGKDKNHSVKWVKSRDGTKTHYAYKGKYDGSDSNKFKVKVKVKDTDGETVISNSSYKYHLKEKSTGEKWTYKLVKNIDGEVTKTVYHEEFGLPKLVEKNGKKTKFKYDKKGRVVKKVRPDQVTKLSYDDEAGKVKKVVKYPKGEEDQKEWSRFKYDENGNLKAAKNSDGKLVKLVYYDNGQIWKLKDQGGQIVEFKEYGNDAKPRKIVARDIGAINVNYSNGRIEDVSSSSGRRVALKVTSTFQNLLDIIRPAGVDLNF